ncbi:MAG: DUF937 domain-containing protein [Chitinophagaceae bacterium]
MSFNLLDSVKGLFTNDLIKNVASSLGESEGGIQKAIGAAVPSVLTGLLQKAGTTGGADSILGIAKEASNSSILGNLSGLLGGGSGLSSILNMAGGLFGDKLGGIGNLISSFAGVKQSSGSSLISMITPAALAALGKHAGSTNLNAGGLLSLFSSQKDSILSAVPAGLNLAGALGLGSLSDIGNKLSSAASGISGATQKNLHAIGTAVEEKKVNSSKWIRTILLTIGVITLGVFLLKQCGNSKDEHATTVKEEVKDEIKKDTPATTVIVPVAKESYKVTLPGGITLDAFKGGIEDRLVTFLNTDWMKLGADSLKKTWFDFDNINFEIGSSKITAESQAQINNIAAILKAYPTAKFKVGGYTDKTGDAAGNKKLSLSRANAVVAAIAAAGGTATQLLSAEGYGSQFAVVPAEASDEERKKDRRIAVSVRG